MDNISYKVKFITLYFIGAISFIVLLFFIFNISKDSDVSTISSKNFESKSIEREKYLDDFFSPYKTSLDALSRYPSLYKFLNNQDKEQKALEETFLFIKRSLPCVTQIRYIGKDGLEVIKVYGTPIELFKDKATSKIVPKNQLQDKSNSDYFKKFINLKVDQIGVSKINLNIENGKVEIPKKPTLRIGKAIYKDGKVDGVLVYNLCLRTFFKLLNRTTLYHVHLIDKNGTFLNHYDKRYGLMGSLPNYSIEDQYPNEYKKILSQDQYMGDNFYVKKISNLNNGQEIRMILQRKFDNLSETKKENEDSFMIFVIVLIILLFPFVIYFAKVPDFIISKAKKDQYKSKLTDLPNRLALMQDLIKEDYESSIVILVSFNNLIRIQNIYGYEISNSLVNQIALYLKNCDNKGIEKIYINNYHIFSIKYNYSDDHALTLFLDKFQKNIENHTFLLPQYDLDFTLHVTLGVSDPHNMNNNIDELQEAENALDMALDKKQKVVIYSDLQIENIQKHKDNLNLSKHIKQAIENNNVIMYFQPIYNNHEDKIEKYECLVRMSVDNNISFPDTFLPVAKQINQYETISYIVVDKSCKYFSAKDYEFSINLSILDVVNQHFQLFLFERINYYNVSKKIVLEIVESEGIENYDEFYEFIKKAKKLGCKIAIDDFGSGYSNFEYIINLSDYIDYLKIDGSLVKDIAHNHKTQILVGSLKFLCDNLKIKTIAEYVEDEDILKYLKSIGIDYSQGYFIGKPQAEI